MSIWLFSPKVESGINTKGAEGIGYGKVRLPIVVGVHHEGSACKIFTVVIDYTGAGYQVEIDVLDPMLVLEIIVVYLRLFESDARKQRKIGYPVLGEHPIVSITKTKTIVRILDFVELQVRIQIFFHRFR